MKADQLLINFVKSRGFQYKEIMYPGSQNKWKQKLKIKSLTASLRLARPVILMPYLRNPNVFCSMVWKNTGALACYWNQRDEGFMKFRFDPSFFKKAIAEATCFISNSKGGALYLEQEGADKNRIEIIKNAIPLDNSSNTENNSVTNELEDLKKEYDFIACMIANLHYNKDHFTLIKAWKIVCDEFAGRGKSPLLILAGKIYDVVYNELMEMINQFGIGGHIKFLNFWQRPDQLLSISDLYIHSSDSEGTSNAILEAMINKKPIVATKILSILDTVSPVNQPYLSEPKNYEQMAGYIIQLSENDSLRKSLGDSNFAFAMQNYSVETIYKKMEQLIIKY